MRLSQAMKNMLRYDLQFHNSTKVRLGRPTHHGNLVTHQALLRRGLIQEDDDQFHTTTLTPAGEEKARQLSKSYLGATEG